MPTTNRLTCDAREYQVMTFDELAEFVDQARAAGADGAAKPKVKVSFGGHLKRIELTIPVPTTTTTGATR